jgi:hypothetical protein
VSMGQAALLFDTNGIFEYVFATPYLRDIRGGSSLLHWLNAEGMVAVIRNVAPEAEPFYADGGMALFVVPEEKVEAAQAAVDRLYSAKTLAATVTSAWVSLPEGWTPDSDLPERLRLLQQRLRVAERERPPFAALPASPYMRPCEACGVDYAVGRVPGDPKDRRLCAPCTVRRKAAWEFKDRFPALTEALRQDIWRKPPDTFKDLSDQSVPSGYLGLIYVDGNGLGKRLADLTSLRDAREFVRAVGSSTLAATAEGIRKNLVPSSGSGANAFEILLHAGDDLIMATRAQSAIRTALDIVTHFSESTRWKDRLTMSGAVVIAHAHFPFGALLRLAKGVLDAAKKHGAPAAPGDPALSALNFLVVNSTSHLDFDDHYQGQLRHRTEPEHILTIRPCSTATLKRLLDAGRLLSKVPRSRVQELREACYRSRLRGQLDALTVVARLRPDDRVAVLRAFDLAAGTGSHADFPWFRAEDGKWRTPLVDLAELLPFVSGEEVGGNAEA